MASPSRRAHPPRDGEGWSYMADQVIWRWRSNPRAAARRLGCSVDVARQRRRWLEVHGGPDAVWPDHADWERVACLLAWGRDNGWTAEAMLNGLRQRSQRGGAWRAAADWLRDQAATGWLAEG